MFAIAADSSTDYMMLQEAKILYKNVQKMQTDFLRQIDDAWKKKGNNEILYRFIGNIYPEIVRIVLCFVIF